MLAIAEALRRRMPWKVKRTDTHFGNGTTSFISR
jgi:hypothetical protein